MVFTLLLCSGLVLAAAPTPADRADYEAANAQAGRDADAHVKLALWCEQHGMTAERAKHLALAVLNDPKNAMARGLMGLVQFEGGWRRPEDVAANLEADAERAAKVNAYTQKRLRAPHTADGQWKLALWCEENGLKSEARAHLTAVVRLDPGRDAAWKRLGYKKQGHRWVTDAQLAAEKEERTLQEKADKQWKPLLEKWRSRMGEKGKRREEAEQALAAVSDARAVPMLLTVFGPGGPERQAVAVRVLGQIDSPGASRALAVFAVFGTSPEVRRVATESLRKRDAREYAGLLVALLRDPIKYSAAPVGGPGSPGAIRIEHERYNVQRIYGAPALPPQYRVFSNDVPFAPFSPQNIWAAAAGLAISGGRAATGNIGRINIGQLINSHPNPDVLVTEFTDFAAVRDLQIGMNVVEVQRAAAVSQRQLANDVSRIEAENRAISEVNERVFAALSGGTGADVPAKRGDWAAWWTGQLGYSSRDSAEPASKPTFVELAMPEYRISPVTEKPFWYDPVSCFAAGTPVRTLEGVTAIEAIRTGDVVLTQDVKTGALRYQPVLVVHHNPPAKTFRVALGDETIVSSEFHRFWKAGYGWVMARDLKAGDPIRTLGGVMTVSSIDSGKVEPVYNLDVAEDADFFVGRRGTLVHDNTVPHLRLSPFDAASAPTTASASAAAE